VQRILRGRSRPPLTPTLSHVGERGFFLSLLSAVLYILSFPNWNLSALAWVALVPLSLVVLKCPPRQAFFRAWLSGTAAYAGLLYWIVVTFQAAHLSPLFGLACLLLLAAYLGLYWGVWAWFLAKIPPNPPFVKGGRGGFMLFAVAGAAAWVALEYLRTYLFTGFPWTLLADSQIHYLPIIQIASVTGAYGVSFLVVLVNVALAVIARSEATWQSRTSTGLRSPRSRWSLAMTAFVPALVAATCYLFGLTRLHRAPTAAPARPLAVALLQGNIDQYRKWDRRYVEDIENRYAALVEQTSPSHPDMILWPETSVPGYLLQDPPLRKWLDEVVRKSGTWHIVGAPVLHGKEAMNSAFVLDPQAYLGAEYGKQHLVPFGEFVPWSGILNRWIQVLNDLGGFFPGDQSPVVKANGARVGVNICYEAIFPAIIRRSVLQGAQVIANLTNDGWYMKTSAPYQHFAPNVLRAVENHRWVIRADNTGISAIIDPFGRVREASPIFQPAVITGPVEPLSDLTFYTRCGDWFAWLCCGFSILAIILA